MAALPYPLLRSALFAALLPFMLLCDTRSSPEPHSLPDLLFSTYSFSFDHGGAGDGSTHKGTFIPRRDPSASGGSHTPAAVFASAGLPPLGADEPSNGIRWIPTLDILHD